MTNSELESQLRKLVQAERKISAEILVLINLAAERRLYLDRGFGSLFDWLTKGFGYSESAARRRISAALLLKSVPEISDKIENGSVNLSTLAKAQSVIRCQEKVTGNKVSIGQKAEIVQQIENKSIVESEQTLLALLPLAASEMHQERRTVVDQNTFRLAINLSSEIMADLDEVKARLSHALPADSGYAQVIAYLAKAHLKHASQGATESVQPCVSKCKSVPVALRRAVFLRDNGKCVYRDPVMGRVCGSRHRVQLDHIHPRALGGDNSFENLRCLCAAHNRWAAEKTLGREWANHWR